jgi:lactate dehydrogenase-like 2-hydroxyacid dehydrogenase
MSLYIQRLATMATKPIILMLDSTVQVIDKARREALSKKFELLYYDCDTIEQFINDMEPGGRYANITAIVRNGWHKAGPHAKLAPFAKEVVPHYPASLRIICSSGHGYDAADIPAITKREIWYCNTPNACTEAVANAAAFMVLDTFRYLSYSQWCARNDWQQSRSLGLEAVDPCGKSIGIVGLGDIGLAIAKKCEAAYQMKVHYQGPRRKPEAEQTLANGAVYHTSVDDMIPAVDCMVLAAPYTKDTHHLLSTEQFALAKEGGLRVVNIARGGMIDEDALLAALQSGKVVGAGLDVHANEPGVNQDLKNDWRVTLLPHIGVCSRTSWENFERINLDNIEAFFATGSPVTPVNQIHH